MSLSYQKLQPILVEEPVTQVADVNKYAVLQGGNRISWKAFTSTSVANSSIQFSCPPPSGSVIVDRNIQATLPVRLTFTGNVFTTDNGFQPQTSLLNSGLGCDAPRAYPFSGALETLQLNINNDSISIPMSDVIHPLLRYNIDTKLKTKEYSTTPTCPDQSFNYSDLVGTNLNPLGQYANSLDGSVVPRGGFPYTIVSNPLVTPTQNGTTATAVVDFYITENLFLSPLFWGSANDDCQGFYNVNSFDLNLSFLAQAGMRMWSHCNLVNTSGAIQVTSIITSITTQFSSFSNPAFSYSQNIPTVQFKYITPNVLTPQKLSPTMPLTYPYFNIQRYTTDIGAVAFGGSPTPISSNNIQLSSIPRRIYVYVRPNNATLQSRCDITDTYLVITNVSVQWANQSVLLSSASQTQLYNINVKNNSSQSWQSWSGHGLYNSAGVKYGGVGSILCLEMASDIQLDGNEAPGLSGQYQLQIQMSVTNMNNSGAWNNIPMALYIITVSEGTFTIPSLGSAQHQESVLSVADILSASTMPGVNYRQLGRLNGGDFLGSLRDFGSKINDFLKKTKVISSVGKALGSVGVPFASSVGDVADRLGYGAGCGDGGVAIQGGRRMTKAELQSRL